MFSLNKQKKRTDPKNQLERVKQETARIRKLYSLFKPIKTKRRVV